MFNLIPALTTTSLLVFVGWLFREAIINRLTKGVQHEYDHKLEILRAEFRKSEEVLKAELRTKEREIESLRSGALAGLVSRQAAVDSRRLIAIDQLWSGVIALRSAKGAAALMSVIVFERALKESANNPRAKQLFESIAAPFDPAKLTTGDASKARPFISPMAWALFSAYLAIHGLAVTQLNMLKLGLDMPDVINVE